VEGELVGRHERAVDEHPVPELEPEEAPDAVTMVCPSLVRRQNLVDVFALEVAAPERPVRQHELPNGLAPRASQPLRDGKLEPMLGAQDRVGWQVPERELLQQVLGLVLWAEEQAYGDARGQLEDLGVQERAAHLE